MALPAPLIRAQHHGKARIGVRPQLPMIRNQAAHRKPLPPTGRTGDRHRHMPGKANGIGRHIRPWPDQQRITAPEAGIEPKLRETAPPLSVALLHQKPIATGAQRPAGQHQRVCQRHKTLFGLQFINPGPRNIAGNRHHPPQRRHQNALTLPQRQVSLPGRISQQRVEIHLPRARRPLNPDGAE